MKIGILSDTHNSTNALQQALQQFHARGVDTLFHCGDLATAEMVPHFKGLEVYFVLGNVDRDVAAIEAAVDSQPGAHWLGTGGEVEIDGKRVAVTHGHLEHMFDALLSTDPDYLLHGHSHRRRDERVNETRVINPGALGGLRPQSRSIAILNLDGDQLEVVEL